MSGDGFSKSIFALYKNDRFLLKFWAMVPEWPLIPWRGRRRNKDVMISDDFKKLSQLHPSCGIPTTCSKACPSGQPLWSGQPRSRPTFSQFHDLWANHHTPTWLRSRPKCTTASQPQSPAIFWIADKIARNLRADKQIWTIFIARCIRTATVSLPRKNRLQACGHHLQSLNVGGLTIKPSNFSLRTCLTA